jgi:hypothetical protein
MNRFGSDPRQNTIFPPMAKPLHSSLTCFPTPGRAIASPTTAFVAVERTSWSPVIPRRKDPFRADEKRSYTAFHAVAAMRSEAREGLWVGEVSATVRVRCEHDDVRCTRA